MKPMGYVCTVSSYNLPELEACLTRQPSDVLLVVSDNFRESAERLKKRLVERLPAIVVHMLHKNETGQTLSGDNLLESQAWVDAVVAPALRALQAEGKEIVLNFTGGTKSIAMALLHGYRWAWVDYKARKTNKLEALRFQKNGKFCPLFRAQQKVEPAELVSAEVLDIPRLHNDAVAQSTLNSVMENPKSAATARELWEALSTKETGITGLFKALTRLWSEERNNPAYDKDSITLTWAEFLKGSDLTHAEALPWLEKFHTLMPEALVLTPDTLTLPGNDATKKQRALRDWVSGLWLEQLCYVWLRQAGIPDSAIGRSVTIGEGGGKREADLLVHYKGQTTLIEVKADVPPGGELKKLEEQLASIGESRFGQNEKVLLCGPELSALLNDGSNKSDAFKKRCKSSKVALYTTADELLKAIALMP